MNVALGFDSDDQDAPRILGGRWQLIAPLARGGMGVLYVGQHLQTGRRAAVKVIENATPDALARFRLEASVSAQLNHPGIVDVFDADLDPETGRCFIAMELLQGRTLRQVMEDPAATPESVIGLLVAALEPLAAAHAKGFVHRDLKPENLFVLDASTSGTRVKLLDFGIVARQAEQRLTHAGTAMGTPHYMSPEQATSARDAGPASDVWSMGVMMYEAIRGEVPFQGETAAGIIVQACTCPHMPLDVTAPGVDTAIARLIDRCLAKNPAERPADAKALAAELRSMLRPNSLPAARVSLPQRSQRPGVPANNNDSQQQNTTDSGVRPSLRSASITRAANVLVVTGVLCSLSALALPFSGMASPGAALLCAAVGGGLLFGVSNHLRVLRELTQPAQNLLARSTVAYVRSLRPKLLAHPKRGAQEGSVRVELYVDLTDAISRRVCLRVMSLQKAHPEDVVVIWKPYWDAQRDAARLTAEIGRTLFEREGPEAFWAFFDRMVNNSRRVTEELLYAVAAEISSDLHGFRRAARTHIHRRSLLLCREEAESRGVEQSPTVVINGLLMPGEPSDDRLHWAFIDAKSALECRRKVELGVTRAHTQDATANAVVRGLLIRYRGARNAPTGVRRTREQARERADKLLSRARMEGADFADVALRFADNLLEPEDLAPRATDPNYLDAVSSLAIDELSPPLECDEGFQVLQRIA
jgi:serine/threonine protein kinase